MEILLRRRFGDEVWDVREWVTPRAWMVRQVAEAIGPADFPRAQWAWVVRNIRYPASGVLGVDAHRILAYRGPHPVVYETRDFWNLPSETLRDGRGDCEDSAILLVSLLRALRPEAPVYVSVGYFEGLGHVWVTDHSSGAPRVYDTTVGDPRPEYAGMAEAPPYLPVFRFNDATALWVRLDVPPPVPVDTRDKVQALTAYLRCLC